MNMEQSVPKLCSMNMEQSVPKRRHIKFRTRRKFEIKNTADLLRQSASRKPTYLQIWCDFDCASSL